MTDIIRKKGYVFCLAGLIVAASCNFSRTDGANRQDKRDSVAIDSVFVVPADSPAQNEDSKLDSLLQVATTAKQDTNLARLYFDIGEKCLNNNPKKAKEYYLKLKTLSEKLKWNEGSYLFAMGYTDILNREGLMDSSIVIYQQVIDLAKNELNENRIATLSANIANCYTYKRWFETALRYYNGALPIIEKQGDKFKLAHLYYLIGIVYYYMDMPNEEMKYDEKALNILNEKQDTLLRAYTLTNYASALIKDQKRQFEKAENNLLEAQRISMLHNNKYILMSIYTNLGDIAMRRYDLDKLEMNAGKSLVIASELGDVEHYCISNLYLGHVEMCKGNFIKSEEYIREALKTAGEKGLPDEEMECYKHLANLATTRQDFRNFSIYSAKADSIQQALISEQTREYAKEMEAKYETEKKELRIMALEKEKRLMTGLSVAAGAVLLLALTAFFFLWRWTVQKRRLAEHHVKQLEQEKQLAATQALLDGETQERTRLARDLHDGLGSMLTGVKHNLLEMKKGATLEFANVERFDKALGLLDRSVQEMRRVAHHLMPDSLSRFGLKPAVSDFCSALPSVQFAYYGNESRLDPKLEVMIYRSIHELVNNALKHAGAGEIMVQIIREPDRIAFTVQDDGCGFDTSVETEGMGLQNIRTRVASYNGMLDIHSKTGEGTEVNVELKVES